jgi:DNA-binding XRE family transcriptional regulator
MPRPTPTNEDIQRRKKRAEDWKLFRKNNLLTQKRLAGITGISRRTIQQIENGHITPQPKTLRLFIAFKKKYSIDKDIELGGFTDGG